jgi:hypothetical protein
MLRTLALPCVILLTVVTAGEASSKHKRDFSPDIVCPTIFIECPENVFHEESDLKFHAHVGDTLSKVKFRWTVHWVRGFPKGRIKSGQGTTSLVVSVSGAARRGLNVTFTILGLPRSCNLNKASCTTEIAPSR